MCTISRIVGSGRLSLSDAFAFAFAFALECRNGGAGRPGVGQSVGQACSAGGWWRSAVSQSQSVPCVHLFFRRYTGSYPARKTFQRREAPPPSIQLFCARGAWPALLRKFLYSTVPTLVPTLVHQTKAGVVVYQRCSLVHFDTETRPPRDATARMRRCAYMRWYV